MIELKGGLLIVKSLWFFKVITDNYMLHFYDEPDILKSTIIKKSYRFYEPQQLYVVLHIKNLWYLDFETKQIIQIRSVYQNNEEISQFL